MRLKSLLQAIGAPDGLADCRGTSLWNAGALAPTPAPTGYCERAEQTVTLRIFAPRFDAAPAAELFFAVFREQEPSVEEQELISAPEPAVGAAILARLSDGQAEREQTDAFSRWIHPPQSEPQPARAAEPSAERAWRLSHARIRSMPAPLSERDALALFRSVCAHSAPQLILDEAALSEAPERDNPSAHTLGARARRATREVCMAASETMAA